jgi:hypothetical protein
MMATSVRSIDLEALNKDGTIWIPGSLPAAVTIAWPSGSLGTVPVVEFKGELQ